jgi:sulfur carrier protein
MLNGNLEKVGAEMNLSEFLLSKGLNLDTIIVEYQGNIVKKQEWVKITLQDKDCLEVLKFVGGG